MDADNIPLLQRGYSRPIGEAEQTSLDALDAAIAAFHEGVTAQFDQRRGYIGALAAAYFLSTRIPPDEAVLVEQREGMTTRWWFESKGDR